MIIEERPQRNASFDDMMADWYALVYVLNSLNRSIGMPDAYPFTASMAVVKKLAFVHEVIQRHHQSLLDSANDGQAGSTDIDDTNIAV